MIEQVIGACMAWGREHMWDVTECVQADILALPAETTLDCIYNGDWRKVLISQSEADDWARALTPKELLCYLGVIEMVVDESCLGRGVRAPISALWDALCLERDHRGLNQEHNFIFEWTPEEWSKV